MAIHGRRSLGFAAGLATLLTALVLAPATLQGATTEPILRDAPDARRNDAEISGVAFVDASRGWAVGDQGAIWATSDGGAHWNAQPSSFSGRLTGVVFADAANGWAVGGWTEPYTFVSHGLVLQTRDGGQHWAREGKLLPALGGVGLCRDRAAGATRLWAFGAASDIFYSALFLGDNRGRDWTPLAARSMQAWRAGDFIDANIAALADADDRVWTLARGALEPANLPALGLRHIRAIKLAPNGRGWLVGDGGAILTTTDAGRNWQPPAALPPGVDQDFDGQTIALAGGECWIAGAPGERIFHTADGGRSWNSGATGQTFPLRALSFVDGRHGWAAGALGTILATSDGGRTWQRQHGSQTQVAALGLFAQADDVPLEWFARSAAEGYPALAEVVMRRDVDQKTPADDSLPARLPEAMTSLGAAGEIGWQFPLRQSGVQTTSEQILAGWKQVWGDDQNDRRLQRHLVRQIRQWRPELIVTSENARSDAVRNSAARSGEPAARLLYQTLTQAIDEAADPRAASPAGLEPWSIKKAYALLPNGQIGALSVNSSQLALGTGQSLADLTLRGRGLLVADYSPPPLTLNFRLFENHLPQNAGQGDFFSGIRLVNSPLLNSPQFNSPLRRGGEITTGSVESLRRTAERRRNLQAILAGAGKEANAAALVGQIGDLVSGLDPESAGEMLFQLGEQFHHDGQWDLAAQCFETLANRFPEHCLAASALVWQMQFYSGHKAIVRLAARERAPGQSAAASAMIAQRKPAGAKAAALPTELGPRTASFESPVVSTQEISRAQKALRLGDQLQHSQPALFAAPRVGFVWAAAARQAGQSSQAEKFYQQLAQSRPHDGWWQCAQGELWLAQPRGSAPKPVCRCGTHGIRPKLDGQLDDPIWQKAQSLELHSSLGDDDDWPATVMLAGDEQYLYLAIRCRRAAGAKYLPAVGPRPRDADLREHDRVDIFLDPDRDYASSFRLSIDHRGWTAESCWGDVSWNPTWYVASATTDDGWTAEAAIAWRELTEQPPKIGQAWSLGVQRVAPGTGFQSWSAPASTDVRAEGFGYLSFE